MNFFSKPTLFSFRLSDIIFLFLLIIFIGLAKITPSKAELLRGDHMHGMIQTVVTCPRSGRLHNWVVVRIYRKKDGTYLYYQFIDRGMSFTSNGGMIQGSINGNPYISRMTVIRDQIIVRDTYQIGRAIQEFGFDVNVERDKCEITGCIMRSNIEEETGCANICRPEACEIRPGPAS